MAFLSQIKILEDVLNAYWQLKQLKLVFRSVLMRSEESTSVSDIKYKVVFLGQINVGKTSIIQRFIRDQFQQQNYPTVGIDFLCRNITFQQCNYRLQIWDTAGQEKYRSLVPAYLRDANCAVFVIDLTQPQSLENVKPWIQLFQDHRPQHSVCLLVGNKLDMPERKISFEKAKQYAENEGMVYRQVSAKTNQNVQNMFETVITNINQEKIKYQNNELSYEEKLSQDFFLRYQKIKCKHSILNHAPCCYF